MNLPPQTLFPNPKLEMDTYYTLFQSVNVRISVIYLAIYESSNTFISVQQIMHE